MKVILFADIHANLSAFEAVLADIEKHYQPDAMISLGDFIDYGMRSNEIIERIQTVNIPLLANLKGNHEKALIDGELSCFSSERARVMSKYTRNHLTQTSIEYQDFDYVLSGHIHQPFKIDVFFKVDNPIMRNQKRTTFINPGSVGQPRNQNPYAQYVYINFKTGETHFNAVPYDIEAEQSLFPKEIDTFYSERLKFGI